MLYITLTDACSLDPLEPTCQAGRDRKITDRHHETVDPLYVGTIHAGGLAHKNPAHISGNGDHTRPDLQLVLNGKHYLVDVTIRHPGCKTNIQHGADTEQLAAAHQGEKEKKAKYAAMAKAQQASFIPFAVETYGGLGKSATKLINLIASAAEDGLQMLSESEVRKELRESVAIAVQKGNANIMLAEYNRAKAAAARSDRGLAAGAA